MSSSNLVSLIIFLKAGLDMLCYQGLVLLWSCKSDKSELNIKKQGRTQGAGKENLWLW